MRHPRVRGSRWPGQCSGGRHIAPYHTVLLTEHTAHPSAVRGAYKELPRGADSAGKVRGSANTAIAPVTSAMHRSGRSLAPERTQS